MINGVLVERTVKDVVPALKTNSEGLKKVLEELVKQYNGKQVEMEKWKVCTSFTGHAIGVWLMFWRIEEEQYSGCAAIGLMLVVWSL